jgi:predicted RNA-binding protein with PUA-like domain
MAHWLLKSEPSDFSIDDLARAPGQTTAWDGVRNFQARNFIRDGMKKGDLAFFYHSSCADPGIAGIVKIASSAYADATALDRASAHFDPKSTREEPNWYVVDVLLERKLARVLTLEKLKQHAASSLNSLPLLKRGSRLSVMPVTERDWNFILTLE